MAIGEPFELVDRHEASLVPPGDAVYDLAAALPLFNQRVSSAEALESGELIVRFENGVVIRVPVNQQYENWEIVSPAGEPWLGLPVAASHTCLLVSRDPIERVPRVESDTTRAPSAAPRRAAPRRAAGDPSRMEERRRNRPGRGDRTAGA